MSPTILGLILAIFCPGGRDFCASGLPLRRAGLLMTPEEQSRPPVVARANLIADELANFDIGAPKGLYVLHADPQFRAFHIACLPRCPRRRNGKITPEWALADAKLADAETIDEAISWLQPKERMAILQDQALIAHLALLPSEPPGAKVVASTG